ncbi:hypothetical protein [Ureaplasma zalophigenitalium]|uniref:Uncharacterized protein n=1 Tax=Ureaplasma zalophigenitalium TaxID=907723 RepID=A0ABT3BPD0_9BACT|nr:hypothetical protein [Ureaplasma zalophigenitalium]MCV3754101.1 hypothetical protein [Ureaplasma zalophigenitalium]
MAKQYRKIIINTYEESYTYPHEVLVYVNLHFEDTWMPLKDKNTSCLSCGTYKLVLKNNKELFFHLQYGLVYLWQDTIYIHTKTKPIFYIARKKQAIASKQKQFHESDYTQFKNLLNQPTSFLDDNNYLNNHFLIWDKYVEMMNQRLYLIVDEE